MVDIHIFGITTEAGKAASLNLREEFENINIYGYSRNSSKNIKFNLKRPDLYKLNNPENPSLILSFCPIWDLSNFLKYNFENNPNEFKNIEGVISTSSTSVLTKRFAFNKFDKTLILKLSEAEKTLAEIVKVNNLNLKIIRPTMIYGKLATKSDQNINKIIKILSCLPFILFPMSSGMRQPIHSLQLAKVISKFTKDMILKKNSNKKEIFLNVGGDEEITYLEMIKRIQHNLPNNHRAKNCKIILVPNRLFQFLIFPLIFINQKSFEAFLRISSNLCGFIPSYKIINSKPRVFPLITEL